MAITLEDILKVTQEIDGVKYFDGESAILLAAAVSDLGRDYNVLAPLSKYGNMELVKLGDGVSAIYNGEWTPDDSMKNLIARIQSEFPAIAATTISEFGHFSYKDPRVKDKEIVFNPQGEFTDLPISIIGRFAGAHFTTLQKLIMKLLITDGFVGVKGEKLNGLELRYWNRRYIEPRGGNYYDEGFYLYYFLDGDNHLVAWKTGIDADFIRDGLYSLIGGSVKNHDSYPGQPSKTLLTRAKFFDHQEADNDLDAG